MTEPLAWDGLPDFVEGLLERQRRGVVPAENAAILFWRAVGFAGIEPEDRDGFMRALGMDRPPHTRECLELEPLESLLATRLQERGRRSAAADTVVLLQERPWTRRALPSVHAWLNEQSGYLDGIQRATRRQRFYSPPPNAEEEPRPLLIALEMNHVIEIHKSSQAFAIRVMRDLGDGDFDSAWKGIQANLRMGGWLDHPGAMLVSSVIADRCHRRALAGAVAYLSLCGEFAQQRDRVRKLMSPSKPADFARGLVNNELLAVDIAVSLLAMSRRPLHDDEDGDEPLVRFAREADPEVALRFLAERRAERRKILATHDRDERRRLIKQHTKKLEVAMTIKALTARMRGATPGQAGEVTAMLIEAETQPALQKTLDLHDASVARSGLLAAAAALQLERLEQRRYPEALSGLPNALPPDPFTGEPFRYERRGDGFLLYSLGRNGIDDGGSDQDGELVDGEYAPIDWFNERDKPIGSDDLVVRFPIPAVELPAAVGDAPR